ncbi:hypothetical protein Ga0466249_000360 [Sporomusaceae bacterium BoRhaA]|uniref:hypothetical protein n=1 Tax=Pelorhabdus rhamnosifermentans TaxID=2772457 RepID=UPI001C06153D|nr:hypothetical protein [Pelorhabdus rhamnosifermentans]MBU2699281.1 hypothetical protein [Pelorhabdus rhamnosifermentans]
MTKFEKSIAIGNLIVQILSLIVLGYIGHVTSTYTKDQAIYTEEQARVAKLQNQPSFKWSDSTQKDERFGEIRFKELYNEGQEINSIENIYVLRFYSIKEKGENVKLIPIIFRNANTYDPNMHFDQFVGKGFVTAIYASSFPYDNNSQLSSMSGEKEQLLRRILIEAGLASKTAIIQSNVFFVIDYQDIFYERHKKLYGWINGNDNRNYDINNNPIFIETLLDSYDALLNKDLFIFFEDVNEQYLIDGQNLKKIEGILKQSGINTGKNSILSI